MGKRIFVGVAGGVLLVALLCHVLVGDDAIIEQEVTSSAMFGRPAQTAMTKTWISGEKMRIETSSPIKQVQILRLDLNKLWSLNEAQKTYMEFSLDQLSAMGEMAAQMFGQLEVKETGVTKQIGEWNCKQVLISGSGGMMPMQIESWMCEDVKIDTQALKQLQKLNRTLGPAAEKMASIPGYAIQTNVTMMMQDTPITSSITVKSIAYGPVPAEMFEIPAGYSKTAAPAGGGT